MNDYKLTLETGINGSTCTPKCRRVESSVGNRELNLLGVYFFYYNVRVCISMTKTFSRAISVYGNRRIDNIDFYSLLLVILTRENICIYIYMKCFQNSFQDE